MTDLPTVIEAIALSPIAMAVSNPRRPDNPLERVNAAFCALTGYTEAEVLGRNCRFLAGPESDPAATARIRAAVAQARPVLAEILNYRRDGHPFRNGVMITPLMGAAGAPAYFLGSQVDLGRESKTALAARRERAAARLAGLAPRQRQVLRLMSRGLLNKQIAWELKIAEKTVKMHRALLRDRLGVATSAEAIRLAVEAGL